jgi:hypothetical protein
MIGGAAGTLGAVDDNAVFDQLVAGLDRADRKKLLEEIEASFADVSEPLAGEDDETNEIYNPELELARMGFLERILLQIKALFLAADIGELLKRRSLRRLRDRINSRGPGLIDFRAGVLTERARKALESIRRAAVFFSEPVGEALKQRRSFFPFLAGLELELVQRKLGDQIAMVDSREDFDDEVQVKNDLEGRCLEVIDEIPEADRQQVYRDAQAFYGLRALTSFAFDSLLSRFEGDDSRVSGAKLAAVRARLAELAEVLHGVAVCPSTMALEALLLYRWRGKLQGEWEDFSAQLGDSLITARGMLARIRDFNRRVPLVAIVRYATENLNWLPRRQGGGEDWFLLYKEFWSARVSRACRAAYLERKRHDLRVRATAMFGLARLPDVAGVQELELKHTLSLQFLKGFSQTMFEGSHRPLKLVYLNGRFYKDQNRQEYTDVFDFVSNLGERVRAFEREFEPGGRFAGRLQDASAEVGRQRGGQRGLRDLRREAEGSGRAVVDQAIARIHSLVSLLGGILHGQPGEPYDTLSNLDSIGGRENKSLIESLKEVSARIGEAWGLLCEIRDVEIAS